MSTSFPPPPTNTIGECLLSVTPTLLTYFLLDWSDIGFKVREVNGHIESTFSHSQGGKWSPPKFIVSPHLAIHGMAPGLNYAVQTFEGMKAFRAFNGEITVFRPDQNAKRMNHSASYISAPVIPEEHFIRCVELAIASNAEFVPPHETGAAMYVRPLLFGSSAQLGLNPCDGYTFTVFVMPTGVYHGLHAVDALILEDFDRAAPKGTGSAKLGGNYAPVLRWSEKARNEGFDITLHLDSQTRSEIDEFSTSGFLGVKKDGNQITIALPDSKNVIKSVTSESVCEIARDIFGFKVEKRPILYEELKDFDEVMAAGTAASLVPVKSITMRSRGDKFDYAGKEDGEPGPVCLKLLKTLKDIQQGKIEDQFGWNMEIKAPPKGFILESGEPNGTIHEGDVDELP
jgi:branched-chain amino acid aminotransferase